MNIRNALLTLITFCAFAPGISYGAGFMPWTDLVMEADKNGDGGLSMDEIKSYENHTHMAGFFPFMLNHFEELDADGDKRVTMYEIKKGTMKMGMTDADVSTGFNQGFVFAPK